MKRLVALMVVLSLGSVALAEEREVIVPNPSKKWAWAVGGVAVGSLLLGAALGGAAYAKSNEQSGNPAMPEEYTEAHRNSGVEGQNLASAGYVFLGIGGVAAIVDAVLWYECLRKPRTIKKSAGVSFGAGGVRF